LVGTLFSPASSGTRPAVVVLGGSEGGLLGEGVAATLARRGYAALALA
jgi:dienelactone hydrolase